MSILSLRAGRLVGLAMLTVVVAFPAFAAIAADADHLVFSEIVVIERGGVPSLGCEFIEIANPTAAEVDLSDYYLTDATRNSQPTQYYDVVSGGGAGGGGTGGDFHCRFPAGAAIAAGDTMVIAVAGSDAFLASYGHRPDFELFEDGLAPDAIPEMVEIFPGSIGWGLGSGSTNIVGSEQWLGDANGALMLYRWDGEADLVQDVDYALWGALTTVRIDKTGIAVDGPDAGTELSTFADDTEINSQQPISTATFRFGDSYQRISFDEGAEAPDGGNGIAGDDETSEPMAATWSQLGGEQDPAAAPAALGAPAPIFADFEVTPAVPVDGRAVTVSSEVMAYDGLAGVSLWYSVDGGDYVEVPASEDGGLWSAVIPAQTVDAEVSWYLAASGAGGGEATMPVAAPVFSETYTVAEAPEPGEGPAKLLLTEVCTKGSEGEFVEIHNPNDFDVVLGDYYLTDAIHYDQGYFKIAGGASQTSIGGGDFYDFNARFPAGAILPAGGDITVSIPGSNSFQTAYAGMLPSYELFEDGGSADGVPDMREVFPGSINGSTIPSLTNINIADNKGEIVILYFWDGVSELTVDIDAFAWGDGTSYRYDKGGLSVGGSTYAEEDGYTKPFMLDHAFGESYQRIDQTEGDQPSSGSNGVEGRDETGEDLPATWGVGIVDPAEPPVPEGAAKLLLSEVFTGDLGGQFVEVFNPNTYPVELGDYYLTDAIDGAQGYWLIASGADRATIGGGADFDFNARFPADATLRSGETITVAIAGSDGFGDVHDGMLPAFELYDDGDGQSTAMREVFPGSIADQTDPRLDPAADGGEIVVLYYWDGESDLTVDIDAFVWGDDASYRTDKGGVVVGASTYADEDGYQSPFLAAPAAGESYQRQDDFETGQGFGGNGVLGRDETSEDFASTWALADVDPKAPPLPEGASRVSLRTPPRTFLPLMGEVLPITFSADLNREVVVRIFDLEGRVVRTLYHSSFDGDYSDDPTAPSTLEWNGRSDEFELVKAGMYIVHLTARNPDNGDEDTETAPAVVATRLGK